MNEAIKQLIREKRAGMTIDIQYHDDERDLWLPLPGHGCYTDTEAREYVKRFNAPACPLRTRPLHEVHPDIFSDAPSGGGEHG